MSQLSFDIIFYNYIFHDDILIRYKMTLETLGRDTDHIITKCRIICKSNYIFNNKNVKNVKNNL